MAESKNADRYEGSNIEAPIFVPISHEDTEVCIGDTVFSRLHNQATGDSGSNRGNLASEQLFCTPQPSLQNSFSLSSTQETIWG